MLSLIIIAVFVGLFVYAGLRLVPVYLENMKVTGTFESLEEEFSGNDPSRTALQQAVEKRFDIESVTVISHRDVEIKKTGTGYDVMVQYSHKVPYLANVSFIVDFDHKVAIAR